MKWRVIQEVYGRRKTVAKDLTRETAEKIVAGWKEMDRTIGRKGVRYQIMGDSPAVRGNPKGALHAKWKRCVQKVNEAGRAVNAYAVCTAALAPETRAIRRQLKKRAKPPKKRLQRATRNPRQDWYIHIQKHGRGPVMLFNGVSFSSPENRAPQPFASSASAMQKARWLLTKHHRHLSAYKMWVSDQYYGAPDQRTRVNPRRRKNPERLDEAARKLEDFTGREATHVERAPARSQEKTGLVIGELQAVEYVQAREGIDKGRPARWHHKFRKGSRPLLAATTDGKQLHIVGGQYEFTEAGIEDR